MTKHHPVQLLTALALACLAGAGCYDDNEGPPPTTKDNETTATGRTGAASLADADRQILQTLHEKNAEEIAVGRMAKDKGASDAVRTFGERLITDHTQNDKDLKALTKDLGISLSDPAKKSAAEQTLEPLSGGEFDTRFATLMREGHTSLVQKVETTQSQVQNGQVKSFLAKTLPVLRQHLQMAQEQAGPGGLGSGGAAHTPSDPSGGK